MSRCEILEGDCRELLAAMEPDSVDAIVCDPPYGLEFMGKTWDRLAGDWRTDLGRGEHAKMSGRPSGKRGFDGHPPTPRYHAGATSQEWHETWAREAYRVLKPGGHLLAFGGSRTYHRMACAVEDAGFEIRDQIMWLYGSGFPKSLDVSKAMDKRRDDYEDACRVALWLRPHIERVGFDAVTRAFGFKDETMARARWTSRSQPQVPSWEQWEQLRRLCGFGDEMDADVWRLNGRKGTPGEAWGEREKIGERDVPDARVAPPQFYAMGNDGRSAPNRTIDVTAPATDLARQWQGWGTALKPAHEPIVVARKPLIGTVAQNVEAHGTGAINIDGCRIGTDNIQTNRYTPGKDMTSFHGSRAGEEYVSSTHAGRWPPNVILDAEAGAMLDEQSGHLHGAANKNSSPNRGIRGVTNWSQGGSDRLDYVADLGGGASRFFYCPKADRSERGAEGVVSNHPTHKPVDLMRWLVRLVTPPGGLVVDPFAGSGTTGVACSIEGFDFVGMELDPEYVKIARARIGAAPLSLFGAPSRETP